MTATTLARLGRARLPRGPARSLHTTHARRTPYDPDAEPREEELVDVCIVGGGPAGLSAAIRLKQLEAETGAEVRVVVLEKGGEVGAHILSGAVIEPSALDALLPDWRSTEHPLSQPVTSSAMRWLTQKWSVPIPHPPQMNNKGNYIASLSRVAAWLGGVAEELGVEVYPGFAGARFLLSTDKDAQDAAGKEVRSVRGVVTHDAGVTRQRTKSARFEPGVAFRARATLLAEGAHGSLAKQAVAMYDLRAGKEPQTYGIGLKEVWRVQEGKHVPGACLFLLLFPFFPPPRLHLQSFKFYLIQRAHRQSNPHHRLAARLADVRRWLGVPHGRRARQRRARRRARLQEPVARAVSRVSGLFVCTSFSFPLLAPFPPPLSSIYTSR
jgi:electron-transferring-flavoprotein dehydrogenase